MADRFYLPLSYNAATVEIDGTEAHHLTGVMRKKSGDVVELFDGNGTAVLAEIIETKKRSALLRIQKIIVQETIEPAPRIILATAVPKGERFRWLVEKATEIGISKIIPLQTTRSVVQPSAGKIKKMRATIIAACKQCERNQLMQLAEPVTWKNLFQNIPQKNLVAVGHPQGVS
ncbi:16S rRNA (uracil(1498)-N(3))-methyltransferase, partial [hydrothermal vent metagenome]